MYPYFAKGMMDNNHQRGRGLPLPRPVFDAQTSAGAGLLAGSPQEVIDKLLAYHELYGISRAIIQMGFGGVPQKEHLAAIERLGTEVAPVVRREVASSEGKEAAGKSRAAGLRLRTPRVRGQPLIGRGIATSGLADGQQQGRLVGPALGQSLMYRGEIGAGDRETCAHRAHLRSCRPRVITCGTNLRDQAGGALLRGEVMRQAWLAAWFTQEQLSGGGGSRLARLPRRDQFRVAGLPRDEPGERHSPIRPRGGVLPGPGQRIVQAGVDAYQRFRPRERENLAHGRVRRHHPYPATQFLGAVVGEDDGMDAGNVTELGGSHVGHQAGDTLIQHGQQRVADRVGVAVVHFRRKADNRAALHKSHR